jgi:ribosomal protein L32
VSLVTFFDENNDYRTAKKQTRKFSYNKLLAVRENLIECPQCGDFHEMQTICGKQEGDITGG